MGAGHREGIRGDGLSLFFVILSIFVMNLYMGYISFDYLLL